MVRGFLWTGKPLSKTNITVCFVKAWTQILVLYFYQGEREVPDLRAITAIDICKRFAFSAELFEEIYQKMKDEGGGDIVVEWGECSNQQPQFHNFAPVATYCGFCRYLPSTY